MRKKSIIAMMLVASMLVGVIGEVALADEHMNSGTIYDYDYELAMERGYLTAEDDLPVGVVLAEGQRFVPAEVPDSGHAKAIEALQQQKAEYSTNDFGSAEDERVWNSYEWRYIGYTQGDAQMEYEVVDDTLQKIVINKLLGILGVPWIIRKIVTLSADLFEDFMYGNLKDGVFKDYLYQAENPGTYGYVHFHIYQIFDKDPDESGSHLIFETTRVDYGIDYMPGVINY